MPTRFRIERCGRNQEGDEGDGKTRDAEPALADPRCNLRTHPAGNRGDDVEPKRHEIGAQYARNPNHHEYHGNIEGECGEFRALRKAGGPAEQRGAPSDRVLADIG
jgi:hypothetical protein